jgi:hypothetical protein
MHSVHVTDFLYISVQTVPSPIYTYSSHIIFISVSGRLMAVPLLYMCSVRCACLTAVLSFVDFHTSDNKHLGFHRGDFSSIPDHFIWYLWWTNRSRFP